MRATLRRSCNACAKAKLRCDLATPQCSRCAKRRSACTYANEPLTATASSSDGRPSASGSRGKTLSMLRNNEDASATSSAASNASSESTSPANSSMMVTRPADASLDPFDSYPATRLPRARVQRLIHHFLSSIAFQYYPLDLNKESNPFVISWWPLALADPALFHVSLQTASLDEELRAQQGFPISELLMADSVSLLRRKIEDSSLAFQDETLNAVVTLAAIEHGKGNTHASMMHIEGIKRMVRVRGGIEAVKHTSALTARMVSWVSMLVMAAPQFQTQDDLGVGTGIGSILQWQLASTTLDDEDMPSNLLYVEPTVRGILARLRNIFHHRQQPSQLTTTELHDLTCFVVHRLLLLPPHSAPNPERLALSECLRLSIALYMLILHGTTYYSHAQLAQIILTQLRSHLDTLAQTEYIESSLGLWIVSVGMASAVGTPVYDSFRDKASMVAAALVLARWKDVLSHLESVLWARAPQDVIFQQLWEDTLSDVPTT